MLCPTGLCSRVGVSILVRISFTVGLFLKLRCAQFLFVSVVICGASRLHRTPKQQWLKRRGWFSFLTTKSQDPHKLDLVRCSSTLSGLWVPLPWSLPLPGAPRFKKAAEFQSPHLHPG